MESTKRALSPSISAAASTSEEPAKRQKIEPKGKKDKGRRSRREKFDDDRQPRTESSEPRLPKRQVAILMSYCGSRYRGMQFQPPGPSSTNTIENAIFDAMVKVGAVSKDNSTDPVKVSLARAARTDAGVHAAGNLISLKLIPHVPGVPDIIARLNEELPEDIRLWSFVRTMNKFNARTSCDSRKYTYFFPTYLLIPPKPGSGQHRTLSQSILDELDYSFWDNLPEEDKENPAISYKRAFRLPQATLEHLRSVASQYVGSHNFHNFTVGRPYEDKSCLRYMKEITVDDPVVYGETEWISVRFWGQSFMLHQIRKMVAALIMLTRVHTPPSLIKSFYTSTQVFIPKAPSLGLLLEYPLFSIYNTRVSEFNSGGHGNTTKNEQRDPIDFEVHAAQMNEFKDRWIYRGMRGVEERDGLFHGWIRHLDSYDGQDFKYLESRDGKIPEEAVRKRGAGGTEVVKKPNPFREQKKFDATIFDIPGEKSVGGEGQATAGEETAEREEKDQETDPASEDEEVGKLDKKKLEELEG